jgi:hypothetical protein
MGHQYPLFVVYGHIFCLFLHLMKIQWEGNLHSQFYFQFLITTEVLPSFWMCGAAPWAVRNLATSVLMFWVCFQVYVVGVAFLHRENAYRRICMQLPSRTSWSSVLYLFVIFVCNVVPLPSPLFSFVQPPNKHCYCLRAAQPCLAQSCILQPAIAKHVTLFIRPHARIEDHTLLFLHHVDTEEAHSWVSRITILSKAWVRFNEPPCPQNQRW